MTRELSVQELTEAECKAELELYLAGSPPAAAGVCETLRMWSESCPGRATPATALWARALQQLDTRPAKTDGAERAVDVPECNGHVKAENGVTNAAASVSPVPGELHDAELASKTLLQHLRRLSVWVRDSGRVDHLFIITASAELVVYCIDFVIMTSSSSVDVSGIQCQLSESFQLKRQLREQLVCWHHRQLASRLLTDPGSQDWQQVHAAEEGERCSFSVQWWWFLMQTIRHDTKQNLSSWLATDVFSELLASSLGQLAVHYGQVTLVSEERLLQFQRDLTVILLCASELLLAVSSAPEHIFSGVGDKSAELSPADRVAVKCQVLLLLLGHLAAPLKAVVKRCVRGVSRLKLQPACWLSLLRPQLIPVEAASVKDLDTNVAVYLLLRMASASFPAPSCWPLLTRALVTRHCWLSVLLLTHLAEWGADTGQEASPSEKDARTACGGALCCDAPEAGCVTLGSVTSQQLFSAIVLIVARSVEWRRSLLTVLSPCLESLPPEEQLPDLWNHHRPLWLQALVHLARPVVQTAVETLVEDVEQDVQRPAEKRVCALVRYCCDVVEDLPPPLLELDSSFGTNDGTPSSVLTPPCGLPARVVLSALYDSLTDQEQLMCLASGGQERRVVDAMLVVSELLIHPTDSVQAEIASLVDAVHAAAAAAAAPCVEEDCPAEDEFPAWPRHVNVAADEVVQRVAIDHAGRRALWMVAAVLKTNAAWLRRRLEIPPLLPDDAGVGEGEVDPRLTLRLHNEMVFWPRAAMLSLGGSRFDQQKLAAYQLDWRALLERDLGQTEQLVQSLLSRRWEMQQGAELSDGQPELVEELRRMVRRLSGAGS